MDGRILDPSHPLSKVTRMPNLEKLAERGVNFVRMYAENPLCAPSRASTFTGRRTSSIRVWNNVKAITSVIDDHNTPDPTCATVVGCKAAILSPFVVLSVSLALKGSLLQTAQSGA